MWFIGFLDFALSLPRFLVSEGLPGAEEQFHFQTVAEAQEGRNWFIHFMFKSKAPFRCDLSYQQRIHSAIREKMIHALQIITAKKKFDHCVWRQRRYQTAEVYYEYLLEAIIDELATTAEGQRAILLAAQLYYEDWSITSMERLKETDRKLHGRDGYLAIELIRQ